jgi:hypothetical protein
MWQVIYQISVRLIMARTSTQLWATSDDWVDTTALLSIGIGNLESEVQNREPTPPAMYAHVH